MPPDCPNKNDIELILKKLKAIATNKSCFDCQAKLPTWSSITYGVFICIDCSAVHRSLGVHISFVRSTVLDTNWTWLQLRQMQLGGNANAESFFRQHNCVTTDAQEKYKSRAAQLYKDKLHAAAVKAMHFYGTALHIDGTNEPTSENKAEELDFFEEHSSKDLELNNVNYNQVDNQSSNANKNLSNKSSTASNVMEDLSRRPEPAPDKQPIIGVRKPAAKKTGFGGKRGGLGAQRIKANFADIEREAELADQLRLQEKVPAASEKTAEEEEAQMTSMRLAYQELSLQQKKEEEKLKSTDPKKAKQVERLGMGFSPRTAMSHSVLKGMTKIEQEAPVKPSSSRFNKDEDSGFDEFFDTFSGSSSVVFMYKGNKTPVTSTSDFGFMDKSDNIGKTSESNSRNSATKSVSSDWSDSRSGGGWGDSKGSGWKESITSQDSRSKVKKEEPERKQPSSRVQPKPSPSSDEAQKKFGAAKSISSSQYFGDTNENTWEKKTNLSRFEGSSSISSADYFNRTEVTPGAGYSVQTPDLEDVRESVRQGVTKVAGKLSSLANGVMSSIQDKYSGGY